MPARGILLGCGRVSCALLLAVMFAGCTPHNAPVSSPPSQPQASHRTLPQAETSLLRVQHVENGTTVNRFMVAFNDDTDSAIPDGNSWQFTGLDSTSGWATSLGGKSWTRHQQVVPTSALQAAGVQALHGDPWLAGWNSANSAIPSIVLYISIGQTGLHRFGTSWFLVVARSLDSGVSFQDPVIILGPQATLPDGPKIAITGDGQFAIAAWHGNGIQYKILSNIQNPGGMSIPSDQTGVQTLQPTTLAYFFSWLRLHLRLKLIYSPEPTAVVHGPSIAMVILVHSVP